MVNAAILCPKCGNICTILNSDDFFCPNEDVLFTFFHRHGVKIFCPSLAKSGHAGSVLTIVHYTQCSCRLVYHVFLEERPHNKKRTDRVFSQQLQ